jgi:tetratricopeptide (TPR) repeat protein
VSCSAKYRPILIDRIPKGAALAATMLLALIALSENCLISPALAQTSNSPAAAAGYGLPKTPAEQIYEALRGAREQVRQNPGDAKAHFRLAELLRKAGRNREAAQEYLETTGLDPNLYVAYHALAACCEDQQVIDEAITRIEKVRETHQKDLMLRVALSELLEKRLNYSQAARVLIDLQYENAVPEKYRTKVNARIHYLLAKSKEAQLAEKQPVPSDDELDVVPAPLPDSGLRKGLTASKIKESREMKGMGHVPLLP